LILVSFLFIKFASLPRPEIAFFAASIGCVSAIHWSAGTEGRRWPGMFVAMVLCAVSISLRTVGAALIPAVFAALVLRLFGGKGTMRRLRAGLLGPIVPLQFGMVATLLVLIALTQTDYFGRMLEIYASRGFLDRASRILELNLFNWGSLMANVPFEKAIDVMGQVGLGRTYATTIVQLLGLSGMLAGILSLLRWSRPGLVMNIYVLGFSAGLFVWPGAVVRLWMPIWPLILGYLAAAAIQMRRRPTGRLALGAWIVWMGITGLAGHAYSMRIAFAGEDFPARYGDGSLSSTYDAALNGRTGDERVVESDEDVTGPNDVYRDAYDLLVRFEPRVDEEVKRSGPLPR
jgi:hypothetical protein